MTYEEMDIPGSFLVRHKRRRGGQRAAQVLADVNFLGGGGTIERFLSGRHFDGLPLTLYG